MNRIKTFLFLLVVFINLPAYSTASKLSVTEVIGLFAGQTKSTADFKEEKYTSFLEQPIVSTGRLEFNAPDKLAKLITAPEKISNKISGDELVIKNATESTTINLKEHPEFSVVLTSIIHVLSGNLAALEKNFTIKVKGKLTAWNMALVPRDSFVHSYIDSITMQGSKNRLTQIRINEANKDYSVTYISNHR